MLSRGWSRSISPSCLPLWGSRLSATTSRPQLALPVAEVVQRKILESGRSLNIAKCRILVHPDSAHLVAWPPRWCPGFCAAFPIETAGAKLLGAPIGTEPFRMDFVDLRASKACASVPALERLPPSATWTVLRYCVNERLNYLAQVTDFFLVQDSLARMDRIIDHALLRAGGLPPEPPDPLTHLTTLTLRSLPTELGGLGIRRYSGLAGETACLHGRTVFYEFAERFAPELLAGAMEDYWPPIVLGAAENQLWIEVAGLFRAEEEDEDPDHLPLGLMGRWRSRQWSPPASRTVRRTDSSRRPGEFARQFSTL
jgi:hypothetical protein